MTKHRDQAQLELRLFANQADDWELAAVFLYMDTGKEATPLDIQALVDEWAETDRDEAL